MMQHCLLIQLLALLHMQQELPFIEQWESHQDHWFFIEICFSTLIADLYLLQQNRQVLIDKQLMMANAKRISFDYQPGQKVLKAAVNPNKLDPQYEGPYSIATVHTNGTVRLQLTPQIQECINICQI